MHNHATSDIGTIVACAGLKTPGLSAAKKGLRGKAKAATPARTPAGTPMSTLSQVCMLLQVAKELLYVPHRCILLLTPWYNQWLQQTTLRLFDITLMTKFKGVRLAL